MSHEAEFIEREALADLHAAATPEIAEALRLRAMPIGSAFVSIAGALPASAIVVNRAVGVGLDAPETATSVAEMLEAFSVAGVERYFVQVHPEARPAELKAWLEGSGLTKARGWQKFRRGRDAVPTVETDLELQPIGPERSDEFARIVCESFDLGDAAVPWLARLPGRPGWHVFMSFDGARPAGVGTVFIRDGLGWTDFGATAPAYRGRGSQGALLARRLEYALALGCKQIFTCTGEEVPGDPQHSFRNIEKCGFVRDYVRENYAPPKR